MKEQRLYLEKCKTAGDTRSVQDNLRRNSESNHRGEGERRDDDISGLVKELHKYLEMKKAQEKGETRRFEEHLGRNSESNHRCGGERREDDASGFQFKPGE